MTVRRLALALPLLVVFALLVPGALAQANGPLIATIAGAPGVAPAQGADYNVTMTGGPTGVVNYSLSYYITGANVSGGSPQSTNPGHVAGNETTFQVNITAPSVEGEITLVVTVVATEYGGTSENTTSSFAITVIKPVVLTATFHNSGTTTAVNVTVRWYVDGALVGTSLIKQIAANADATVTYNYLPVGLSAGQHTVTVTADLDHDGIVNAARGEVSTSTLFYNQVTPPATGWIVLLGIGIFIPVFLGVVAIRRRGQR